MCLGEQRGTSGAWTSHPPRLRYRTIALLHHLPLILFSTDLCYNINVLLFYDHFLVICFCGIKDLHLGSILEQCSVYCPCLPFTALHNHVHHSTLIHHFNRDTQSCKTIHLTQDPGSRRELQEVLTWKPWFMFSLAFKDS